MCFRIIRWQQFQGTLWNWWAFLLFRIYLNWCIFNNSVTKYDSHCVTMGPKCMSQNPSSNETTQSAYTNLNRVQNLWWSLNGFYMCPCARLWVGLCMFGCAVVFSLLLFFGLRYLCYSFSCGESIKLNLPISLLISLSELMSRNCIQAPA